MSDFGLFALLLASVTSAPTDDPPTAKDDAEAVDIVVTARSDRAIGHA